MAKYNQGVKQYEQMQTAIKQYDSALNALNTQFGSYDKAKEMQNTLTAQYNALPEGDAKQSFRLNYLVFLRQLLVMKSLMLQQVRWHK